MIDLVKLDEHRELFGFFAGQLVYPDKETFGLIRESGEDVLPPAIMTPVTRYREQMLALSMEEIEELYVDTFDFEKSSTLYMTYSKYEDSKDRGQLLTSLKAVYEMFGLEMEDRELPDFLPLMLEFLYAADWLNHPHGETGMLTVITILEDGTFQLMKSLESKGNPYYELVKALRETFKLCLSQEVKIHESV
ncbi:MAG: nitrate reductase molybdenum cofactor assembly chaperone [Paenibacillus sp.]|uniref:nitrate reductase molybdenum cofactor assembly chaperone n=1 Tax=Paenibacillus sp. TaxID=58172 RepID=UPI002912BA70|nr:nitrate reductase molybdenum cofactor assembly chaperone [Paenibacillus sp.]MDU4697482.1 nitrate reductase molybdenum cofactor assembly chaperone [Paenibacillus sp.]